MKGSVSLTTILGLLVGLLFLLAFCHRAFQLDSEQKQCIAALADEQTERKILKTFNGPKIEYVFGGLSDQNLWSVLRRLAESGYRLDPSWFIEEEHRTLLEIRIARRILASNAGNDPDRAAEAEKVLQKNLERHDRMVVYRKAVEDAIASLKNGK